jgi:uncharacterized membrane protein
MTRGCPAGVSVPQIAYIDLFSFAWFLACWIGYTLYSDRTAEKGKGLVGAMERQRIHWMHQMVGRDNRMVDLQIVRSLSRTSSFFASTSMLILAGLVTVLGATDRTVSAVAEVPLVSRLTQLEWELRLIALTMVFVYTFFKFTWSIRQLSYCAIQVGAMVPANAATEDCIRRSTCIARIATLAARHFNRGLRGYYFAAVLATSFIHPAALIVATTWLILVLYRREYHSNTLALITASEASQRT